jgi:S-DNA-T family DNA segregation ATPase FtsK/SpoIIIE
MASRTKTTTGTGRGGAGRRKGASKASSEVSGGLSQRGREILSLALLGATVFLALSCLSAGRGDNLCGRSGEALAGLLLSSFGHASWLIVGCFGIWGSVLFTRSEAPSFSVRGAGLLLCLVTCSALIAHLFGESPGPYPAGGVLGEYINRQLIDTGGLGVVGTRIVLLVLTLITFVLATDIAYYAALATGARWVQTQSRAVQSVATEVAERRRMAATQSAPVGKASKGAGTKARPEAVEPEEDELWEEQEDGFEPEFVDPQAAEAEAEDEEEDGEELEYEEEEEEEEEEEDGEELAEDGEEPEYEDDEPAEDDIEGDVGLMAVAGPPKVKEMGTAEVSAVINPDGDTPDVDRATPGNYVFPSKELLEQQENVDQTELDAQLAEKTATLETTLQSFRIEARVVEIQKGPVISMFELELAPGIKVERLRSLEDDLAIALRARSVRIVAPIPGKNTVGIEVPNPMRETVRLRTLLDCPEFTDHKFALPIFLGRDAAGTPMVVDLAKMPHLLVAGATGSGKSVCLNTIIASFLYTRTPEQVKLVLIDPKMVEMSQFANAPHLACPVVSDMKRAPGILEWAVVKMEERYRLLHRAGVRNIYGYNKLGDTKLREIFGDAVDEGDFPNFLPFIVIVVDELADLMMTAAKDVETSITRIAAKSRAVGIHIILATQRPSTNVITGLIKANLPTRIAFMVSSKIDSRVILDSNGAEQLLGQGDMLYQPPHTSNVVRGQCTFMSDEEVQDMMAAVRMESGPAYVRELVQSRNENAQDPTEVDDLYDVAVRFIIETGRGSASLLQRKFAVGYTRASRLVDLMAQEGVLGEYKGSQAREVTMVLDDWVALNPEARASPEQETV